MLYMLYERCQALGFFAIVREERLFPKIIENIFEQLLDLLEHTCYHILAIEQIYALFSREMSKCI